MFNNKQDVAARGLPDGVFFPLPSFFSFLPPALKSQTALLKSWASGVDLPTQIWKAVSLFFSPSLSKYRGRSEPTFRQGEEVFFRGMVSLEEVGRTGAGEALATVSFAKWLPGRKPLEAFGFQDC